MDFRPFCSCDVDLDPMSLRTWPVFSGDILYVQIWTSYVEAFESYRLTDRHDQIGYSLPRRLQMVNSINLALGLGLGIVLSFLPGERVCRTLVWSSQLLSHWLGTVIAAAATHQLSPAYYGEVQLTTTTCNILFPPSLCLGPILSFIRCLRPFVAFLSISKLLPPFLPTSRGLRSWFTGRDS